VQKGFELMQAGKNEHKIVYRIWEYYTMCYICCWSHKCNLGPAWLMLVFLSFKNVKTSYWSIFVCFLHSAFANERGVMLPENIYTNPGLLTWEQASPYICSLDGRLAPEWLDPSHFIDSKWNTGMLNTGLHKYRNSTLSARSNNAGFERGGSLFVPYVSED
jgi:hypothetical protein